MKRVKSAAAAAAAAAAGTAETARKFAWVKAIIIIISSSRNAILGVAREATVQ